MSLSDVPRGRNVPEDVNVIIEIPMNSEPVKYEVDKASGAVFVDRLLTTPMRYPCNYGYVPHTLSGDGDPIDALVLMRMPLIPACVIHCRPIGILAMEDEAGPDEKLLVVPHPSVSSLFDDVTEAEALPALVRDQISHFFLHYKDLEKGKWVRLIAWRNSAEARAVVLASVERYEKDAGM
ncbi:MAG: inorganic diphosphatase [Panacagrimonas sp.]